MLEDKIIIGWQEWAALPELCIEAIKIKADTGALTSSLHADEIEFFRKKQQDWVRFVVYPLQRNNTIIKQCTAPLIDKRHVTSSSGYKEHRPVIRALFTLGEFSWEIELNLTKRDYMGFRMLLGRNAMHGRIIIDPTRKFLYGQLTRKQAIQLYKSKSKSK